MFSKVTKKFVAVALVLSLALATAAVTPAEAAAKLKLNKKSLSLNAGKTATLKANVKAKFTSSKPKVASVSTKKAAKKVTVRALSKGTTTITAKAGKVKATCKVTVKAAAKGQVIYDLAKETGSDDSTGKSWRAPFVSNYSKATSSNTPFKYSSFAIWLCRATFYDPANGGVDYRGKKLHCDLSFKNSGKRDLPELGFCFNYTKGGTDGSYPFALHISEKGFNNPEGKKVAADKHHKHAKLVKAKIKKGKTYNYSFDFTIPADAMNGDKDSKTGLNYPIMFYLANLKDSSPYKVGDEVTILKCKFTVAS